MNDAYTLGCAHCLAINRVNQARLNEVPRCGKCHKPLFTGEPLALTATNFTALVERSSLPMVVDFWASWCGPCKAMAPIFAEAARELEPSLRFAKLDTEAEQALAGRFAIRSIPTLMVFRSGQEVARQAGLMSAAQLKQWLHPHRVA